MEERNAGSNDREGESEQGVFKLKDAPYLKEVNSNTQGKMKRRK